MGRCGCTPDSRLATATWRTCSRGAVLRSARGPLGCGATRSARPLRRSATTADAGQPACGTSMTCSARSRARGSGAGGRSTRTGACSASWSRSAATSTKPSEEIPPASPETRARAAAVQAAGARAARPRTLQRCPQPLPSSSHLLSAEHSRQIRTERFQQCSDAAAERRLVVLHWKLLLNLMP